MNVKLSIWICCIAIAAPTLVFACGPQPDTEDTTPASAPSDQPLDTIPDTVVVVHPDGEYEQGYLILTSGDTVATGLFLVRYIGQLGDGRQRFHVVSAWPCVDCDALRQVFFLDDGGNRVGGRYGGHYPGVLSHYENGPYYRSRFFVGDCLNDGGQVALWVGHDIREARDVSRVARVVGDTVSVIDGAPIPSDVQLEDRVSAGVCKEIPPEDQTVV